jgi:hypothetical protein
MPACRLPERRRCCIRRSRNVRPIAQPGGHVGTPVANAAGAQPRERRAVVLDPGEFDKLARHAKPCRDLVRRQQIVGAVSLRVHGGERFGFLVEMMAATVLRPSGGSYLGFGHRGRTLLLCAESLQKGRRKPGAIVAPRGFPDISCERSGIHEGKTTARPSEPFHGLFSRQLGDVLAGRRFYPAQPL